MKLSCICFTGRGERLARELLPALGWDALLAAGYGRDKADLRRWTENAFAAADVLLFVGAAGIAVRAVAPLLQGKAADPAVLVMDEEGRYVIPLLSGHIGGANRAAKHIAALSGGRAVITTATDINGLTAIDEWAVRNGMFIQNPDGVKRISSRQLRGETIWVHSAVSMAVDLPDGMEAAGNGADVVISPFRTMREKTLHLVPRCIAVGIGCRKNAAAEAIESAFWNAAEQAGICEQAVCGVYSIDRKAKEPGLLAFCQDHGWALATYTAEALARVRGSASSSAFVEQTVQVDNVCERSALAAGGRLLLPKLASGGVTVALALREPICKSGGRE